MAVLQPSEVLTGVFHWVFYCTPFLFQISQAEKTKKLRRQEQNRTAAKRFRSKEKKRRKDLLEVNRDHQPVTCTSSFTQIETNYVTPSVFWSCVGLQLYPSLSSCQLSD